MRRWRPKEEAMKLPRQSITALGVALGLLASTPTAWAQKCDEKNTVVADVVAIDMPMVFNRLGAQNVNWQMYALRHDLVVRTPGQPPRPATDADIADARRLIRSSAHVTLRPDLRPRPLTLRVAAGECLRVNFTNLLTNISNPFEAHNWPLLPSGHPMDQRSNDRSMDIDNQVASRTAGFHPSGLELVDSIASDSSHAGANATSLVAPGGSRSYTFFAPAEGSFLVTNPGAAFGGEGTAGTSGTGLFGAVAVQPVGGRAYRGQVTEEELRLATRLLSDPALAGQPVQACAHDPQRACTPHGQPVVHYDAVYPTASPWTDEGKAGWPILAIEQVQGGLRKIVHGDVNAIIVGPQKDGSFPPSTYPLESTGVANPSLPNRLEAFREFVSVFHDENAAAQAFPGLFDHPVLGHTLHGVRDAFMINYGSAGVGAEVIANRLKVGPMHDCVDCAFEEFFLSSFTIGDPALLVDRPANLGLEQFTAGTLGGPDLVGVNLQGKFADGVEKQLATLADSLAKRMPGVPLTGPKASKTYYPHDPANVHHSYVGDFVKFRNLHTGKEQHIFHLHNHQWLFNPNDDNSNYIDAQAIGPGAGYTYEIAFGGSGNRNKSAGDAVFHCHYYPHFAQGMWYLWRNHDTFEAGTALAVSGGDGRTPGFHKTPFDLADGTPAKGARALPDGEIAQGTPIPAVVPLPGKPLAVMPGQVQVVANPRTLPDGRPVGSLAKVVDRDNNPGFPFWIAGIEDTVGSRPPTPPLDMLATVGGADGGVPRHAVEGYSAGSASKDTFTRLDASKKETLAKPKYFPERGTDIERVAMKFHAQPGHTTSTVTPSGAVAAGTTFVTNGGKPEAGAPFFDPCLDDKRQRLVAGHNGAYFGNSGLSLSGQSPFNADTPRIYKGANIQLDVTINKLGDHYPQQRILTLWEDVDATLATGFRSLPGALDVKQPRPPEPLVLRMNTFDCARYLHTNLVPKEFEMDDYQVRTPTDIIGQHIHLPKWDLPSADGSANGWNYEDGTFSPGMVRGRIHAINEWNAANPGARVPNPYAPGQPAFDPARPGVAANEPLAPQPHYYFGRGGPFQLNAEACLKLWQSTPYDEFNNEKAGRPGSPGQCDWLGARTTIQRWFSDPIINKEQQHRGLGITFTHDHLGPSTHQQVGLYATMLTEPPASTWVHNETAELLYTRDQPAPVKCDDLDPATWRPDRRCDGGPTTWQAVIRTGNEKLHESHREFFLQFGDFQHAYRKGEYRGLDAQGVVVAKNDPGNTQAFRKAVTPSFRKPASPNFPNVIALPANCPGDDKALTPVPRPCPELISADDIGTMVVNYRQEPVAARVMNLDGNTVDNPGLSQASQTSGNPGDLAFAYQTRTDRALTALNTVNGESTYPPLTHDVRQGDPYTPLLRAYSGDLVRIKIQAGSHEHEHNGAINGLKWLQAGSGFGQAPHSGWRGAQNIGLSEQFTLSMRITDYFNADRINSTDRLYATDTSQDGLWNGVWGLVRTLERRNPALDKAPAERDDQDRLAILPLNPLPTLLAPQSKDMRRNDCPANAPVRRYHLVAGLANRLLGPAANVALTGVGGVDPSGGTLVYNPRPNEIMLRVFHEEDDPATPVDERTVVQRTDRFGVGPLHDPTAILIARLQDIDPNTRRLRPTAPVEPVVLRAAAGECVEVTLENWLPPQRRAMPDLAGFTTLSMLMPHRLGSGSDDHDSFNNNRVRASNHIGLHPQMVQYDVQLHDGTVVGGNSNSLVGPGQTITYKWYAGELTYRPGAVSGQACTVSEGVEGGYDLINFLRAHERQTPDGLRLWRPPNQLFTRSALLSRLEQLLSPIDADGTDPAADDTERTITTTTALRARPLVLNRATFTALRRLQPSAARLAATATPPAGISTAEFDNLLAASFTELLTQFKAANIESCFEDALNGKRADQTVPEEVARNLAAVLGTPAGVALPAPDSAVLYAPEAALSTVEALERRESCAVKAREPMANALVKTLANSRYANLSTLIAQQLASSIAYLVPELDADALGGKQYAQAFRWLEGRERASLSKDTTRLVNPMPDGGQCQFAAIEFGGTNLSPPDRIKQGQKAAVGAFVIEPERSLWWEPDTALDRQNPGPAPGARRTTRSSAHAFYPAAVQGSSTSDWRYFRDLVAVHQKGLNMRYGKREPGKSSAVGSIAAERADSWQAADRIAPEDAHDAGQMAINYGSEPMWFRFGMDPSAPFGHGPSMSNPSIPGQGLGTLRAAFTGFADSCCVAEDGRALPASPGPYTPIFRVLPLAETRMRVMMPTGVGRGSVMTLHGHGWQRDPYLAERAAAPVVMAQFSAPSVRLTGGLHAPATTPVQYGVPSQCQGRSGLGMRFGAQDSVTPMAHYDWLLESAGGFMGVPGDYLLRDIGGFGLTSGLWGLMRVQGTPIPLALRKGQRTACH
jgi:manganese oxidase